MRKLRKATFIKAEYEGEDFTRFKQGELVYVPVNKLAHKLVKQTANKRSVLKAIARKGSAMCYVWTNAGLRKVA